jgi:hypothetical protein
VVWLPNVVFDYGRVQNMIFYLFLVTEWRGKDEPSRQVQVGLDVQKMQIHVLNERNTTLRLIDLKLQLEETAYITTAKDKTRKFKNLMNLHVKRGYNLVSSLIWKKLQWGAARCRTRRQRFKQYRLKNHSLGLKILFWIMFLKLLTDEEKNLNKSYRLI